MSDEEQKNQKYHTEWVELLGQMPSMVFTWQFLLLLVFY